MSENKIKKEEKLYLPYMLSCIAFIYMGYILPFYSKELGMDSVQIAGLSSIFSCIVLILKPFVGRISDKFGRKPILIISLILYSISFYVYSISTNASLLYIARSIQAIASPMMSISVYCMIVDNAKKNEEHSEHLGEKFGKLDVYSTRGGIIGIVLVNIIYMKVTEFMIGWKYFLYICCISNLISIIYIIKNIKETKIKVERKTKKLKFTTNIKKLMIVEFILNSFSSLLSSLFILYLIDKFEAGVYELGFAYMLPLIISSILPKYIGRFGDKLGRIKSMTVSLFLRFILLIIFTKINNMYATAILYSLMISVSSLLSTASGALFADETGIEDRGQLVGTYSTITGLGAVFGPILGGLLYKNISVNAPFYLCGLGNLVVMVLVLILFKNYTREKINNNNSLQ